MRAATSTPPFPPTEEFLPVRPLTPTRVMVIGEQPGEAAGRLFDKALAEAGLDRASFRATRDRGRALASPLAPIVFATAHPAAILRVPDEAARREAYRALVADLRIVAEELRKRPARRRKTAATSARQRQLPLLP